MVSPAFIIHTSSETEGAHVQYMGESWDGPRYEGTISAEVVAYSIPEHDREWLASVALEYPRLFVHQQLLTHRKLSRNASSSRATPVRFMIDEVKRKPALPVRWGINGAGMQDHGEMNAETAAIHEKLWLEARDKVVQYADGMLNIKPSPHKQIVNRMLEPWAHIRVLVTMTETGYNSFMALREKDAQPEICALAATMKQALASSSPRILKPGEWHIPYVASADRAALTLREQLKVSTARCARVSYLNRKGKPSRIEDDLELHDDLVVKDPMHASPSEHQAVNDSDKYYYGGISNFEPPWVQYRKFLERKVLP